MLRRHQSASAEQTEALGAELAEALAPGDVVLVEGDLGTGKTTFVRGACRKLGVRSIVTSPTFTIGQRYAGPRRVAHVDLFRVPDLSCEDPELLADYLGEDLITFVEWPQAQALQGLGRMVARVRIAHAGGDQRVVEIECSEAASPRDPAVP